MRLRPLLAIVYFLALFQGAAARCSADEGEEITALFERWNSISDSVVSSKLSCRQLLLTPNHKRPDLSVTRDQMNRFFHEQLVPLVTASGSAAAIEEVTKIS
jgi:hypothetical protein